MAELVKYLGNITKLNERNRRLHIPSFDIYIDFSIDESMEHVKNVAHSCTTIRAFHRYKAFGWRVPESDVPDTVLPEDCIIITADLLYDPNTPENMANSKMIQAECDQYNLVLDKMKYAIKTFAVIAKRSGLSAIHYKTLMEKTFNDACGDDAECLKRQKNTDPDVVVVDIKLFQELMGCVWGDCNDHSADETYKELVEKVKENNPNFEPEISPKEF